MYRLTMEVITTHELYLSLIQLSQANKQFIQAHTGKARFVQVIASFEKTAYQNKMIKAVFVACFCLIQY